MSENDRFDEIPEKNVRFTLYLKMAKIGKIYTI